ncbi:RluA family pseudouridine synthase|nr:RluA family pseudouridine synthase [Dendrosporobacter quercicolus]NSL46923.1 RluA family pseudouridine synthase [Dendrosporobacter quercicolus DSM 1736]
MAVMTEKNDYVFLAEDCPGERVDAFLARQLAGLSRSHIQKLIADACVSVNGRFIKANYKLQQADRVAIAIPAARPVEIAAEPIPLAVLYEDAAVIVVNKPRGMVVHPAAGNYNGTLVNALLGHCGDLSGINGELRPGIVHRLDKDTSGVMVAAKNDAAHVSLARQIKDRSASRKYIAIVHGNVKAEQGVIDAPIGRRPTDRKRMAVVFTNSKNAVTRFKVLERFGQYTVIACRLQTGRTHQIRVHMQYIGHPVVGDPKYGPDKPHFSMKGQALHSEELKFIHPVTKEEMVFTAPLPADMQAVIERLRADK